MQRLGPKLLAFVLCGFAIFTMPAFSCQEGYSITFMRNFESLVESTPIIFVGVAGEAQPYPDLPLKTGSGRVIQRKVNKITFDVLQQWQGPESAMITVLHDLSWSCSTSIIAGRSYLVIPQKSEQGHYILVGHAVPLESAESVVNRLNGWFDKPNIP